MIFGAIVPIVLIAGLFGYDVDLALYGLETTKVYSIIGLLIIGFIAIKGAVSIGLWTEKDWAVDLAIIDATIGIIACVIIMLATPFIGGDMVSITFRIEILLLIPYLMAMNRINAEWKSRN